MMKKKIGIFAPRAKNLDVRQKGYDNAAARSIVNTQVMRDIVEDVLERGYVSSVRREIASSY